MTEHVSGVARPLTAAAGKVLSAHAPHISDLTRRAPGDGWSSVPSEPLGFSEREGCCRQGISDA